MRTASTALLWILLFVTSGCVSSARDCPPEPTEPPVGTGTRTELISPWRGGSSQLPASGTSAGPLLQANQSWLVPIGVNIGEQLSALSFRVYGDGAVDVDFGLFRFDYVSNMNTLITSGTVPDAPATWIEMPLAINSAVTVDVGQALIFFFQPNAANAFAGLVSAEIAQQPKNQPRPAP